jgi:HlyD family secretion protein
MLCRRTRAWIFLILGLQLAPADPGQAHDGFTIRVEKGACHETYTCQGELRARRSINIQAPEVPERYLTVKSVLEDGTRVRKGDVLLTLDDALYQLALEAARQELELKKAELERTRFELEEERASLDLEVERKRIAVGKAQAEVVPDSTIVSDVDLKKARLSVKLAQVELDQAVKARGEFAEKFKVKIRVKQLQAEGSAREFDKVKKKIDLTVVKAPEDGVVYKPFVQLNNEKGRVERNRVVRPGDKLLELPSFDAFRGVLHVAASDIGILRVGDPAMVRLSVLADREFPARVSRIDPYPMTRNERLGRTDPEGHLKEFEVGIDLLQTHSSMRPGLTFTTRVTTLLDADAVRVPRAAIQHGSSGEPWIYVRTATGLEKRPIALGRIGLIHAAVTKGLATGDLVELVPPP